MSDRETESRQPDDPSLEDILASIRQIVFENDDEAAVSGAREGKAGQETSETAPEAATTDSPADEPFHGDGGDAPEAGKEPPGERFTRETGPAAQTGPPQEAASLEPQGPAADEASPEDRAEPSGCATDDVGADPGDTVLLLTEMIAPDGSVVRLDPPPVTSRAETPPAEKSVPVSGPEGAGDDGSDELALDAAAQDDLAATVREWLDRHAPEMIDRAARRELRKLADRQE